MSGRIPYDVVLGLGLVFLLELLLALRGGAGRA